MACCEVEIQIIDIKNLSDRESQALDKRQRARYYLSVKQSAEEF